MVPEISNPNLQDIAMVTWFHGTLPTNGTFYNGLVICYNPIICQQAGPNLTAFFHAHEYGHIHLQHVQKKSFELNPYSRNWMSQKFELEADAYATEYLLSQGNTQAIQEAINWFYGMDPTQYVTTHPPGMARAKNIITVANKLSQP